MSLYKIFLAVFAMMVFGLNAVFGKMALVEIPPILFNFIRFIFIFPCLFFISRPNISWAMLGLIAGSLSILHLCLTSIALAMGASAGMYVLLLQTGSLFALLFAFLLMGTKPTVFDILGIGFGLFGVYWICTDKGAHGDLWAILLLVGSAAMWGLGFTFVKKAQAPSLPTNVWASVFALPFLGIASGTFEGLDTIVSSLRQASLFSWFTVLFSGWASMLGAGGILMYLMRTESVAKVVPFNMLTPVFGCFFSYLIIGEQITWAMVIGGALILFGLVVSQFGSRVVGRLFPKPA
jgi:O-acetylserine/cysteine efflux transporter